MSNLSRTSSNHNNNNNNNNVASMSSTALMPQGVETSAISRPRNRRAPSSAVDKTASASHLSATASPAQSRGASPLPSARLSSSKLANSGRSSPGNASFGKGLLEGTWTPSWTSVQDFASSLLSSGESGYNSDASQPGSRSASKARQARHKSSVWKTFGGGSNSGASGRQLPDSWGPAPRPRAEDIAAGSVEQREAKLKAMKTASVLESYDGVNGGLDVAGKHKRRNSDEGASRSVSEPPAEEQLVYLHHVQPTDTYAGVVLRYRCQEHAFRKTNGLWSRDGIQVRKQLMIPVDACEVKGRPCDPPSFYNNQNVDHLATTPQPDSLLQRSPGESSQPQALHDDFFASRNSQTQSLGEEEQPWTHVRWVKLDSNEHPVEIVRVSRKSMGFFPPRRKKSIHTVSAFSSPRQSIDMSRGASAVSNERILESPARMKDRRQSSLSSRPNFGSLGTSPSAARSRGSSVGQNDNVPAWMRRPGGVGSMSRSIKAPGPAKDSLNTWVNKRLPKGFSIDSLPSMSVMGSESAHWGFTDKPEDDGPVGIVESPFEDGRDAAIVNNTQGLGLEQAAATVETWLRSAWSKRPVTPVLGSRKATDELDLIELTDTNSDDGRLRTPLRMPEANPLNAGYFGTTARDEGDGSVRGRSSGPKGKKAD